MNRAVFLDRDGVLVREIVRNKVAYAPIALDDFHIVTEAAEQVRRLREAGFHRIVFTNQPEVAKGLLSWQTLDEMHRRLHQAMALDDVYVCPHDGTEAEPCRCRKPSPGMLQQAAERWGVSLPHSYVVGDRWRDIDAGRAAGCFSILIERPYSQCPTPDARVSSLAEAVDLILTHESSAIRSPLR